MDSAKGEQTGGRRPRRYPVGAEIDQAGQSVHFRAWAPRSRRLSVLLASAPEEPPEEFPLEREADSGYFSASVPGKEAGMFYRFRTDRGIFPDLASRFQPQGPSGPSEIIDPAFPWSDQRWRGRPASERVIYELHLGTFTPEGTWRAAAEKLPLLAGLGITVVEIMPIADFPGIFGWGYDGVGLFAPFARYGRPSDARAFVDRAHGLGLMVLLDVVYNHVGPEGAWFMEYAEEFFGRTEGEWGRVINFDGPNSGPVREFYVANGRYWISEFHFDGLRFDATQQIFDRSPRHILGEIAAAARQAGKGREIYLVAENEPEDARLLQPVEAGGCGLDAIWNDDFHHSARVAATGRREAYYRDYLGRAQEFVSALKRGFLFQGQWNEWQRKRRGRTALGLGPGHFIHYLENHDQVANTASGHRLHQATSPGRWRALTALLLLGPATPLLFQGQEFAASAPFRYFADHGGDLREAVRRGRRKFVEQFPSLAGLEGVAGAFDPAEPGEFAACKLDWSEYDAHSPARRLHADLLRLRRDEPAIARCRAVDGAVLGERALLIRYFAEGGDGLLLVNLGPDLSLDPLPEPLFAAPPDTAWELAWSSESPVYGGGGTPRPPAEGNGVLPAESAAWMRLAK